MLDILLLHGDDVKYLNQGTKIFENSPLENASPSIRCQFLFYLEISLHLQKGLLFATILHTSPLFPTFPGFSSTHTRKTTEKKKVGRAEWNSFINCVARSFFTSGSLEQGCQTNGFNAAREIIGV